MAADSPLGGENGVLRGLGKAELENLAGFLLDGFARLGVAHRAGLLLLDEELAEAGKKDSLVELGASVGDLEELVISDRRLLLGDLGGLRNCGEDCTLRGWNNDFLCSHF